jgi:hypothetical protein
LVHTDMSGSFLQPEERPTSGLVRKKNQEVILKLYRLGIEPKLHVLNRSE